MIEIKILASGSSGNAYIVNENDKSIMIECGLPFKKLQKLSGYKLSGLDFCIISHEHKDHCRAWDDLCYMGVTMVMSDGTFRKLIHHTEKAYNKRITIMSDGNDFPLNGWNILPFGVQHDAEEPMGFLIRSPQGKKICYATDTFYLKYKFSGVNHWMVECNYAEEYIGENEKLSDFMKDRIRKSHFEIGNLIDFLNAQDLSATESIYLLHLSNENANAGAFVKRIEEATGIKTYANL